MLFTSIKTEKIIPPKDNLNKLLFPILEKLKENNIVAVSSKVISITEGNCIKSEDVKNKDELIISESDLYLERNHVPGNWLLHTIKNGIFIPTAGIDESNSNGYFILWPKDPEKSAEKICKLLKEKSGLKNVGVIITDSHSIPLRRGLVGLSIALFGFKPLIDYRGAQDIFGRELKVSQSNIPDSLAAGAVLCMGEGNEQTPLVIISDLPKSVEFIDTKYKPKGQFSTLAVPIEEDLFKPFLTAVPWKKPKQN